MENHKLKFAHSHIYIAHGAQLLFETEKTKTNCGKLEAEE